MTDFSLVLGGPLFQLLRRTRLADDALKLLRRRIAVISLLAWLPLGLLAWLQGPVTGASISFWQDLEVHIRFLVALPLLIVAELVVHRRMLPLVARFRERQLIPENCVARFEGAVASAMRLRNSLAAELTLILVVYFVGVEVWRRYTGLNAATWYAIPCEGRLHLTLAGLWYGFVSLPIFQFMLLRWYFRLFIWTRFLWQVSRLPLQLVPTHPDRRGGLAFLGQTVDAFMVLLLAHGALLAGQFAMRILFLGARLPDFKGETAALLLFLLALVLGPLVFFAPQLHLARLKGLAEYGTLANDYVRAFDAKWLRGGAPAGESLLGSGDIQSLADLGNSFAVVREMGVVPFAREPFRLVAATLAPLIPLGLTMMPLEELVEKLVGVLL